MSSDSVVDDILALAELLSMSDISPSAAPGVDHTPAARPAPRRGGR
jgi:hypothetical protein